MSDTKDTRPTKEDLTEKVNNFDMDTVPDEVEEEDEATEVVAPEDKDEGTESEDTSTETEETEDESKDEEEDAEEESENEGDTETEEEKETPSAEEVERLRLEKERSDKRYSDSTREAQILYSRNKKMADAIDEASNLPEPTDDELKEIHPEWDKLSDFEKLTAKKILHQERFQEAIRKVNQEFKNIEVWNEKVDKYLEDPATLTDNPILDGREDEFRAFVNKEQRVGADFETLVLAFKGSAKDVKIEKKKGKMFEGRSGGENGKPKETKMTIEESKALKASNYALWKQKLMAGEIETDIN